MNNMELRFNASLINEAFARMSVISFITPLNPSLDEISEVKTIVSEAVSNAIIHGYKFDSNKYVYMKATIFEDEVEIIIKDYGVGIENVKEARVPHYTSRPDLERAGMGLTIIDSLSDSFNITSIVGVGVKLIIKKKFHPVVING